jgi:hypothetical protein
MTKKYMDKVTDLYSTVILLISKNETCKITKKEITDVFNNSELKVIQNNKNYLKQSGVIMKTQDTKYGELLSFSINFYENLINKYGKNIDYPKADCSLLKTLVDNQVDIDEAIELIKECSPHILTGHKDMEQYLAMVKENFLKYLK